MVYDNATRRERIRSKGKPKKLLARSRDDDLAAEGRAMMRAVIRKLRKARRKVEKRSRLGAIILASSQYGKKHRFGGSLNLCAVCPVVANSPTMAQQSSEHPRKHETRNRHDGCSRGLATVLGESAQTLTPSLQFGDAAAREMIRAFEFSEGRCIVTRSSQLARQARRSCRRATQ